MFLKGLDRNKLMDSLCAYMNSRKRPVGASKISKNDLGIDKFYKDDRVNSTNKLVTINTAPNLGLFTDASSK
jgi:hypothetical protein